MGERVEGTELILLRHRVKPCDGKITHMAWRIQAVEQAGDCHLRFKFIMVA